MRTPATTVTDPVTIAVAAHAPLKGERTMRSTTRSTIRWTEGIARSLRGCQAGPAVGAGDCSRSRRGRVASLVQHAPPAGQHPVDLGGADDRLVRKRQLDRRE